MLLSTGKMGGLGEREAPGWPSKSKLNERRSKSLGEEKKEKEEKTTPHRLVHGSKSLSKVNCKA